MTLGDSDGSATSVVGYRVDIGNVGTKHRRMHRYLISFDDGSMDHIPHEDLPEVSRESRAVVQDAKDAGVWIFGGGLGRQQATIVGTDGSVSDGPTPEGKTAIGGFAIIEVSTPAEALEWAARLARGCRCAQEVREIGYDPES